MFRRFFAAIEALATNAAALAESFHEANARFREKTSLDQQEPGAINMIAPPNEPDHDQNTEPPKKGRKGAK